MKPAPFAYVRATSLQEALEGLGDQDAKLLAGGQSLLPMLNLRLARPAVLIDVDGLTELDRVANIGDELVLGALVRHDRLARDPAVGDRIPLLAAAARHIGHVAIRNRGSLGGSLAHADPTAELPAVCTALGARIVCDRANGRRRELAADGFFHGLYATELEPQEMITWIRIPMPRPGVGWGFAEAAPREGDFAWAGAACMLDPADDGLRTVVFGVERAPRLLVATGGEWSDPRGLARWWASDLKPISEPEFRRDLAIEMIDRAVRAALGRVQRHG